MLAVEALRCTTKSSSGADVPIQTVWRSADGKKIGSFLWRNLLPEVLRALDQPGNRLLVEDGPVYQFGVYTGMSMKALHRMEALKKSRMLGFDSFQGLPDEDIEKSTHTTAFLPHMLRVSPRIRKALSPQLGPNVTFIAGYYNESLKRPGLVQSLDLKPARYVDVDVDLYVSTKDLLAFMLEQRLLVPGTVIGYDDWWSHSCARNAPDDLGPLTQGEGLAHMEAATLHKVTFACLAGGCRAANKPCGAFGAIFLVVSVGERADPGFHMSPEEIRAWKRADPSCRYVHTETRDTIFTKETEATAVSAASTVGDCNCKWADWTRCSGRFDDHTPCWTTCCRERGFLHKHPPG